MSEPKLIIAKSKPSLEEAQKAVGGYVELVELSSGDQILVNEEGLLKNDPQVNIEASMLAGKYLFGDALLLQGDSRWME
jgi:uncharacterized protein (AIM24 family)